MKNDEILIAERIKELKEENAKLKDKVEGLQDRIDKAVNYIENHFIDCNLKELYETLKGE